MDLSEQELSARREMVCSLLDAVIERKRKEEGIRFYGDPQLFIEVLGKEEGDTAHGALLLETASCPEKVITWCQEYLNKRPICCS